MTGPDPAYVAAHAEVVALEVDLAAALAAAGLPIDITRPPTAAELASRTNFAGVDADIRGAASELASLAREGRAQTIRLIGVQLAAADTPAEILAGLDRLAARVGVVPGADAVLGRLEALLLIRLDALADTALARFRADAARAGIRVRIDAIVTASHRAALAEQARRVAAEAIDAAVRAVRGAAYSTTRAGVATDAYLDAVLGEAADTGAKALDDVASQAAIRANGAGRMSALDEVEGGANGERVEIYASELLDRNTCAPCAAVDGRQMTPDEAAELYPDGRYIECRGGDRCRGTPVVVLVEETPATLPRPGDRGGDTTDRFPVER